METEPQTTQPESKTSNQPDGTVYGIGGFAKAFIDLGASAVVAPVCSVKDDIAHEVMLDFYERALTDPVRPFADILTEIRAGSYDSKDEIENTYAAYGFYGDPLARRVT